GLHGIEANDDPVQRDAQCMRRSGSSQSVTNVVHAEQIELHPLRTQGALQGETRAATSVQLEILCMEVGRGICDREAEHLTIAGTGAPDRERFVFFIEYGNTEVIEPFENFALGLDNL